MYPTLIVIPTPHSVAFQLHSYYEIIHAGIFDLVFLFDATWPNMELCSSSAFKTLIKNSDHAYSQVNPFTQSIPCRVIVWSWLDNAK